MMISLNKKIDIFVIWNYNKMCCNRGNRTYYESVLLIIFILKIIIGSICILTHSIIGYLIGSILIIMAIGLFIKIVLMIQNNNNNNDNNNNDNDN